MAGFTSWHVIRDLLIGFAAGARAGDAAGGSGMGLMCCSWYGCSYFR